MRPLNVRILFIALLGVLILIKPSLGMALSDIRYDDDDNFQNIQKLFKKRKQDLDEYTETVAGSRMDMILRRTPPARTTARRRITTTPLTDLHYCNIPVYIQPSRKVYLLSGKLSL